MKFFVSVLGVFFISAMANSAEVQYLQPRLVLKGHTDWAHSVAFLPNSNRAVTASYDGTVRIWGLANGEELSRVTLADRVNSVAVSPDGRLFVSGGRSGAFVWDVVTSHLVAELRGHEGIVTFVAFSKDGRFIATGGVDKTARLWSAVTFKPVIEFRGHSEAVLSVAFSPDSTRLYSAGDQTIRVWSVSTGKSLGVWRGHSSTVRWVSISRDGRHAATTSYDGTARIWSVIEGRELISWRPGGEVVTSAEFLPDGRILTASRDLTPKLWVKPNVNPALVLRGHTKFIEAVAISSDGLQALTASWDNTVGVWDLP
jgi:WD40 repeat protein